VTIVGRARPKEKMGMGVRTARILGYYETTERFGITILRNGCLGTSADASFSRCWTDTDRFVYLPMADLILQKGQGQYVIIEVGS
jgi:hypothetical protein